MKKMIIFFAIVISIICVILGLYINYKANYYRVKKQNFQFEKYLNQEIYGTELTTIINRAINNNQKNEVEKDESGIYLNNNESSINIQIKITDNDKIYQMEILYRGGMQNFVSYYGNIKFKCTKIEYHNATNRVKYLFFEQITE